MISYAVNLPLSSIIFLFLIVVIQSCKQNSYMEFNMLSKCVAFGYWLPRWILTDTYVGILENEITCVVIL